MSEWRKVKLKEVLNHKKGSIKIDNDMEYKLCRVQLHRRGVLLRGNQFGHQIKTKKQQVCQVGDLIVAEMDAKFGGYGFIPDELAGAIVSSHYYLYELDKNKISQDYFQTLISTDYIQNQIEAKGSTNYSSIRAKEFLEYEIPLANQNLQAEISKRFLMFSNFNKNLNLEHDNQKTYLTKLCQAILQEAIEGKLTADWRVKNPVCLGDPNTDAAALLATIKAEKQKLIAKGKIRKEKPLAPINPDDVPFALPKDWVWVRLGEIEKQHVDCPHATPTYLENGITCLRSSNITTSGINFAEKRYVSESEYIRRIERLKPEKYDLIYIREGGRLGIAGLINVDEPCCLGQRLMLMRFFENITARYCCYFVNAPSTYQTALKTFSGAASPHINVRDVINNFFPLPPLSEQYAIVERVDRLLNYVNALEQQVIERKSHAEQLMQAVLKEAFTV